MDQKPHTAKESGYVGTGTENCKAKFKVAWAWVRVELTGTEVAKACQRPKPSDIVVSLPAKETKRRATVHGFGRRGSNSSVRSRVNRTCQ